MKSNQERSNECLPPKKREIPATSRPSEEKAPALPNDNHRAEGLAWLSSHPGGPGHGGGRHGPTGTAVELALQQGIGLHKSLSTGLDYSPPSAPRSVPATTTLPTVYPPPPSGTPVSPVQYAHLPHTFQFIGSSQYSGPYAGFIPSQLISPTANPATSAVASAAMATTPSQRSQLEAYSTLLANMGSLSQASGHKVEQQQQQQQQQQHLSRTPGLMTAGSPPPTQQNQYVHISSSPQSSGRTASPPTLPVHLHPHQTMIPHTLTLGPSSQVVVQYTDSGGHFVPRESTKKAESSRLQQALQAKEILNGEMEKSRRYGVPPSADLGLVKAGGKAAAHPYESRHMVVHPSPADYSTRDIPGVRASVMVLPNSNTPATDLEVQQVTHREASPSTLNDKSSLHLGKASHRSYALSPQQALGPEGVKAAVATLSPHSVIQTTHSASEPLPVGLPATAFYAGTQAPVIGYLSSQQQAITYAGSLPQHLVIPGTQPLLIPVGNADMETSGAASAIVTSSPQFAAVPHTFVTTAIPKSENFSPEALAAPAAYPAMVQAQIHLPVVQSVASPSAVPPTLPPYFMKGSIIQLANGELKKVEDLKTEDFIQSAEISNDLKIDSSTVERIEDSHSPGVAVIQFAVGEHRAQVSVEVLVEYPFFVFGQGWSSCCPERTSQLFDLPCSKLSVGDVCISLTLKNLKNGSVKKGQSVDPSSVLLKHSKTDCLAGGRHRYAEQENGINQGSAQMLSENGELKFPEKTGLPAAPLLTKIEPSKPMATRKRRWSAPETRKLEKSEDEPPLTLPKPSLIPQEVKICIEGRSNVGK
nr:ataxin-1 [Loxodonta africana]XP_010594501.1 ataxin-1 [Loxodonta africana]XP_010594502.1 ataxin-1 [Loxodonta africana]XP_023411545.1 ataxin-1 [Loxodonta africana]XP_023411546.1 ataxin-1 [Loxodonta africana]XP_023411547.1 ataxin-1 [Loxodonta africana]XP_023411548.1 ataxin-1 [Loxodonta africana]XP_023411549.1 ataxin-1 [Loxodonta africana]XP_023411550.1 ataxin-1 [Loxodonta africana]XP_023411551.1 ataxin-1 [Loxodonta africana]XP_023411552.1 ataxin-1 [Loxodonta africana]XP_023411553.1 ataxi